LSKKPTYYQLVETDIQSVERLIVESIQLDRPDVDLLLKNLFTSGGKRIRPNIALLVGKLFDSKLDSLITVSAAIEMLHTATLVHDDLIDNSIFRRGNKTLNAIWTPAATVLAGDYLFAKAAEHAADTNSVEVMRLFSRTLGIIVRGEITQFIEKNNSLDIAAYYDRIFAKTASLFQTTTTSAGILANVNTPTLDNLKELGYSIGMAFQIIDDVLDFTGNQATLGKPIGSDLRNKIITLPSIFYFQDNKRDFEQFIKSTKKENLEVLELIIDNISHSTAIEQALEKASEFIESSCQILEQFPANQYTNGLRLLVEDSLTRIR
jgi:geranylgeranyl pyrophosphate synthase